MRTRVAVAALALSLGLACAPPGWTDGSHRDGDVVVTFLVDGREHYRILLTDPEVIETAYRILEGEEAPRIPNGRIVRGQTSVNDGYSWHIDPDSLEFVDLTMEVCDGLPSDVEAEVLTADRYCPWAAEIVDIEDAGDVSR